MEYQFFPELSIAVNKKNTTDTVFARLCADMCAGTTPYSKSAILSAMEHCDDAMEALWVEVGRLIHQDSSLVPTVGATVLTSFISDLENRLGSRVERKASSKTQEIAIE